MPSTKKYDWKEVAQHNTRQSAWVAVSGKVYDVTKWIEKHPGGEDVVLLAAGRDATQIFETYHDNLEMAHAVLKKYEIGYLANNELPVFPARGKFFLDLKKQLDDYFKRTKQDPKFHWAQILRYAVVFSTIALSYYAQFFYAPVRDNWVMSYVMALVLGFMCAQVGLIPLHDASHCSFTRNPWVWRILGATHDFINGCSYLNWCYQHQLGHHPYTNVADADPDISTGDPDVRRIKSTQPWYKHYIKQELFVPVLYGVLGMKVRVMDVNLLFIQKKNDSIRCNPVEPWHFWTFWLGKVFFVLYRFIVPLVFTPLSFAQVMGRFIIADLTSSYWLAFTFQANHVVDGVEWPLPNEKKEIKQDWAELQVLTAQDYAHNSFFWANAAGALNFQVVHHLFPNILQHYYPEIAPIVRKVCKDYNVKYIVKDTYWEAFSGHLEHLRKLEYYPSSNRNDQLKREIYALLTETARKPWYVRVEREIVPAIEETAPIRSIVLTDSGALPKSVTPPEDLAEIAETEKKALIEKEEGAIRLEYQQKSAELEIRKLRAEWLEKRLDPERMLKRADLYRNE